MVVKKSNYKNLGELIKERENMNTPIRWCVICRRVTKRDKEGRCKKCE